MRRYVRNVSITLTERMIAVVAILLVASLLYGQSTQDYTPLRLILLGGMYLLWTLYIMGVIAVMAPSIYERLGEETGLTEYVVKAAIIVAAALTLLLVLSLARIPLLLNQ